MQAAALFSWSHRGYPEHVKGMSDAVYGGGTLTAELPEGTLELLSISKQYDRTVGRDGTYSHGFLRLKVFRSSLAHLSSQASKSSLEDRTLNGSRTPRFCSSREKSIDILPP